MSQAELRSRNSLCILSQLPPSPLPISVLLAFILLVLRRVNEPPKLHIDMDLYSQDQGNLQKDELELTDTCKKRQMIKK